MLPDDRLVGGDLCMLGTGVCATAQRLGLPWGMGAGRLMALFPRRLASCPVSWESAARARYPPRGSREVRSITRIPTTLDGGRLTVTLVSGIVGGTSYSLISQAAYLA